MGCNEFFLDFFNGFQSGCWIFVKLIPIHVILLFGQVDILDKPTNVNILSQGTICSDFFQALLLVNRLKNKVIRIILIINCVGSPIKGISGLF